MESKEEKVPLLFYVPPILLTRVILLEGGIVTSSIFVTPIQPDTDVKYEWINGGDIGGDYEW